jgi:hypothetical protein
LVLQTSLIYDLDAMLELVHSFILALLTHTIFVFYNAVAPIYQNFDPRVLFVVEATRINLKSASILPFDVSTPHFVAIVVLFCKVVNIFFDCENYNLVWMILAWLPRDHVDGFVSHE